MMERLGLVRGNHSSEARADHVAIGIRPHHIKLGRCRYRCQFRISTSSALLVLIPLLVLLTLLLAYTYLALTITSSSGEQAPDDVDDDSDFLTNVTRTDTSKVLSFGRDDSSDHGIHVFVKSSNKKPGLYNEAGRNELKIYEAEYEASLKTLHQSNDEYLEKGHDAIDATDDDDYDDGIDSQQTQLEEYDQGTREDSTTHLPDSGTTNYSTHQSRNIDQSSHNAASTHPSKKKPRSDSKRKPKRRKFSGSCEMKFFNSTAQLIEPLESRNFARFSLQCTEVEERPQGKPRFAGHQNL